MSDKIGTILFYYFDWRVWFVSHKASNYELIYFANRILDSTFHIYHVNWTMREKGMRFLYRCHSLCIGTHGQVSSLENMYKTTAFVPCILRTFRKKRALFIVYSLALAGCERALPRHSTLLYGLLLNVNDVHDIKDHLFWINNII